MMMLLDALLAMTLQLRGALVEKPTKTRFPKAAILCDCLGSACLRKIFSDWSDAEPTDFKIDVWQTGECGHIKGRDFAMNLPQISRLGARVSVARSKAKSMPQVGSFARTPIDEKMEVNQLETAAVFAGQQDPLIRVFPHRALSRRHRAQSLSCFKPRETRVRLAKEVGQRVAAEETMPHAGQSRI